MISSSIHACASRWRTTGSAVIPRSRAVAAISLPLVHEAELLAERERAALERERAHRDLPTAVDLADDEIGRGPGAVEEDLVELRRPGDLLDRSDLDAGLVHRHEQVGDAPVPGRVAVGAGEHEAPLRPVRERRPHLLPVDHPLVAVALGTRREVGEVRSRVRAPSSPGTTAPRRSRSGAGTGPAARRCRSAGSSARSGPRRRARPGPARRRARTPRRTPPARAATRRARRTRGATTGRSSPRRRARAPTRAAPRRARARRRGRPARARRGTRRRAR